jgi:hypothetical protein
MSYIFIVDWTQDTGGTIMAEGNPANYALRGFIIGILVMVVMWFFPLPIAAFVLLFHIKEPFGDIMLKSVPILLLIPIAGWAIGLRIPRGEGAKGKGDTPEWH